MRLARSDRRVLLSQGWDWEDRAGLVDRGHSLSRQELSVDLLVCSQLITKCFLDYNIYSQTRFPFHFELVQGMLISFALSQQAVQIS